jgi:hypothetical protein
MKKIILALATIMASQVTLADGFRCKTESGLNVKVYNHTDAAQGTRTASFMVISDENIGYGNKTIASFSDIKNTLSSKELVFVADVDLRVSESSRKGESIGGTKLGQLDQIVLSVAFSYAYPIRDGDMSRGRLYLVKRNGEELSDAAVCTRYLKQK